MAEEQPLLSGVKHILLVLSGKGGVGKSTMTTQIALSLVQMGNKVGILDVDLCGPSIPHMFGVEGKDVHQSSKGWVPVFPDSSQTLSLMSIGFLLNHKDDAVVWRGPKKNAMIKQFLTDVIWEDLDYLIVDTPPGNVTVKVYVHAIAEHNIMKLALNKDNTLYQHKKYLEHKLLIDSQQTRPLVRQCVFIGTSDEHISVVENIQTLKPDGAILVTTPQDVSTADVRREFTFCRKTKIPVLGIIENMSGFVCPHCSECTNIFSSGGGEALAAYCKVPFLGRVPLDSTLVHCVDEGKNYITEYSGSPTCLALRTIVENILSTISEREIIK